MNAKNLLSLAGLILILYLFVDKCSKEKDLREMENALSTLKSENAQFETTINLQGQELATQSQIIVDKRKAIELGLRKIEGIKNYKNQVSVITETKFDTIYAQLDIDTNDQGELSTTFNFKEEWISFNGELLDSGVLINDLKIKNDYTLTIADKKLGFFKKPEPIVVLLNRNPYTKTQGMNNLTIKQEQPFYKRPWIWLTLGLGSGILISRL